MSIIHPHNPCIPHNTWLLHRPKKLITIKHTFDPLCSNCVYVVLTDEPPI